MTTFSASPGPDSAPTSPGAVALCIDGRTVRARPGASLLEAARAGMAVKGVVSFHGGLDVPAGDVPTPIATKVLVCHGAVDPFVPAKDVAAFQEEMKAAKADYVFIAYAGAVHAFTQKEAGDDPSKGAAYNEAAAVRSWRHMKDFFGEIFK